MEWNVINTTAFDIYIDAIWIDWPLSHEKLKKVKLDGDTLWDGEDEDPPSWMPPWSTGDAKKLKVKPGDTRVLKFEFDEDAGRRHIFSMSHSTTVVRSLLNLNLLSKYKITA